jgi:hypothetical protein
VADGDGDTEEPMWCTLTLDGIPIGRAELKASPRAVAERFPFAAAPLLVVALREQAAGVPSELPLAFGGQGDVSRTAA